MLYTYAYDEVIDIIIRKIENLIFLPEIFVSWDHYQYYKGIILSFLHNIGKLLQKLSNFKQITNFG